ncbi:hypothetical protein SAMN05421823_102520 [Catalinimonas alkaloidigena]|uniref:Uncharacterized protein n=1 Tax=Catalinimonas alkaloidigena TaxID=1075417 RepID=A0A1G9B5G0_9BACT|nr:hypothetical protein [Catalinimonas alkaloidigena]SDK34807.1 hypothetical protein SAMN05421823_102520 [Catalinimonas alkaloidigena]
MRTLRCLLVLLLLSGCATYQRCQRKFAETVVDTVQIAVPIAVAVPKDSVVTRFHTDTTHLRIEEHQGRARVVIHRYYDTTYVYAYCDTLTVRDTIPVTLPHATTVFHPATKAIAWYWWVGLGVLLTFLIRLTVFVLKLSLRASGAPLK